MRLIVWIPQSKTVQMGVRLPAESIIWYAGKPWAYVKLSEELFARRSVPRESELDDAWFVRDGFTTDEHIVVSGAQLLLSEEFRWQIPEEDTD